MPTCATLADRITEAKIKAEQAGYQIERFFLGRYQVEDVYEWYTGPVEMSQLMQYPFMYRGFLCVPVDADSHFSYDVVEKL